MIDSTKTALIEAIISFDIKANELIRFLAEEYNLDLETKNPFSKLLIRTNNLWKGEIRNDWKYQFHGGSCQFENKVSGQLVDVRIIWGGNYGAIHDNFYLLKYIETTRELNHLFTEINSQKLLVNLLTQLEEDKILINIGGIYDTRWILNYELLKSIM